MRDRRPSGCNICVWCARYVYFCGDISQAVRREVFLSANRSLDDRPRHYCDCHYACRKSRSVRQPYFGLPDFDRCSIISSCSNLSRLCACLSHGPIFLGPQGTASHPLLGFPAALRWRSDHDDWYNGRVSALLGSNHAQTVSIRTCPRKKSRRGTEPNPIRR